MSSSLMKRPRLADAVGADGFDLDGVDIDEDACSHPPLHALPRCGCTRMLRIGWGEAEIFGRPVGVFQVLSVGAAPPQMATHGIRYHAIFGGQSASEAVHLGCFATSADAAAAWDVEARSRGWQLVNEPVGPDEQSVLTKLRRYAELVSACGFPFVPTTPAWRTRNLVAALHAASAASDTWLSPTLLQQRDHWSAPGNLLCLSFQPHIFATSKAKTCAAGWQEVAPRLSARDWFESRLANRARAVRSVLERFAEAASPLESSGATSGSEALDGRATYRPSYASVLRREITILSGSWVLNFQPLIACAIYRRFAPASKAVVYDPCAGWGGRLLGAALARNVGTYIACEPSSATYAGLRELEALFRVHAATRGMKVELLRRGAEDTPLPAGSVDCVFTSPPYFNLELYADGEPSQAHVKYPTHSWWEAQFLGPLVRHAFGALRPGGHLLLNVSNNRMLLEGGMDLEQAVHRQALRAGFEPRATLRMLKPTMTRATAQTLTTHCEPIFVFAKPAAVGATQPIWGEASTVLPDLELSAVTSMAAPTAPPRQLQHAADETGGDGGARTGRTAWAGGTDERCGDMLGELIGGW